MITQPLAGEVHHLGGEQHVAHLAVARAHLQLEVARRAARAQQRV